MAELFKILLRAGLRNSNTLILTPRTGGGWHLGKEPDNGFPVPPTIDVSREGQAVAFSEKLLPQLAPLQVPCIDAAYVFEAWANPDNRFKRVWCASDDDWAKLGSDPFSARI